MQDNGVLVPGHSAPYRVISATLGPDATGAAYLQLELSSMQPGVSWFGAPTLTPPPVDSYAPLAR